MENKLLEAALEYQALGFSVIPITPGEKDPPLLSWKKYQTEKATREEIVSWWTKNPYANIGIVTGKISNLFVVDLDKYKDQYDDELSMRFFSDSLVTPSVLSPRQGEHLYFSYPLNLKIGGRADAEIAIDYRAEGNYIVAPPSVNGTGEPYKWNNSIFDTPLSAVPESYISYINAFIYKEGVDSQENNRLHSLQTSTSVYKLFQEGSRDQDLFHIANKLVLAKTPVNEILQVIKILAKNCNPPFPENEIDRKILSALNREEGREKSLAQEIREFLCLQPGTINLQTVHNCLQLSTRAEKKNASIILKRLSEGEDRMLDRVPGSAGVYKTVNKDLKRIDLSDKSDLHGELPIDFPFEIEKLIKPMPGCVYIIAGETDSGKSAFLMNFAKKNVGLNVVHYFSTEMGKQEFSDRLAYFWPEAAHCKNLNFYERYEDFDQVIFPDDINIIDYLELFEDFYKMAGAIKQIGRALKGGVAFIALQKPQNRDEGEGGERTKNLPRLYLSLSPNKLKIVKAKNWRNSMINPNKLEIEFKLLEGCKFRDVTTWKRKET
ncbi:MAG TPA: bifunctional DNA primase/polymerase [Candidatus Wunengus sp. YC61]|uniref:bifunctional DNA primase/polymerase n=1 Tax=Candidatus Wunengus sp. YC61 TaxID=3367698 RepID=UPI0040253430